MSTDKCNEDVFKLGESCGLSVMSKEEAEAYCQKLTEESDYIYDWHYVAGRVHVMRLKKGFKKEMRYIVIKHKELRVLDPSERIALAAMISKLHKARLAAGKKPLEGVFIESDWKCYDEAWRLVAREAEQ